MTPSLRRWAQHSTDRHGMEGVGCRVQGVGFRFWFRDLRFRVKDSPPSNLVFKD
jgi:hypothetical protein